MKNQSLSAILDPKISKHSKRIHLPDQSAASLSELLNEFSSQRASTHADNALLKSNRSPTAKKSFSKRRTDKIFANGLQNSGPMLDNSKANSDALSCIVPPGQRRAKILSLMGLSPDAISSFNPILNTMSDAFHPSQAPASDFQGVPHLRPVSKVQEQISAKLPLPEKNAPGLVKEDFSFNAFESASNKDALCLSPTSPLISEAQLRNILNYNNNNRHGNMTSYSFPQPYAPSLEKIPSVEEARGGSNLRSALPALQSFSGYDTLEGLVSKSSISSSDNLDDFFPLSESINSSASGSFSFGSSSLASSGNQDIDQFLESSFNQYQETYCSNPPESSQEGFGLSETCIGFDSFPLDMSSSDSDGTLYSVVQSCVTASKCDDPGRNLHNAPQNYCFDNFTQDRTKTVSGANVKNSHNASDCFLSVEEFMEQLEELTDLTLPYEEILC